MNPMELIIQLKSRVFRKVKGISIDPVRDLEDKIRGKEYKIAIFEEMIAFDKQHIEDYKLEIIKLGENNENE